MKEAKRWGNMLGGGMRQAGVWASAGIVALDTMVARLAEDHAHAKLLATLLADEGFPCDSQEVETNMVFFEMPDTMMPAQVFVDRLANAGVTINPPKRNRIRFVTHADVDESDIRQTATAVRGVVGAHSH